MTERTPDGHYLIINGRRWRTSDPHLPPERRQELVNELMAARRAVKAALAAEDEDEDAEREARAAVHRAKVALGERGTPWWEEPRE